ncbi:extracellular solute-binding protein [Candidatus Bipolaricaulota bacterium]
MTKQNHRVYRWVYSLFLGVVLALCSGVLFSAEDPLLFLSTQFTPLHEADAIRNVILADFPDVIDFEPYDNEVFMDLILGTTVESVIPELVGTLHGDFIALHNEGVLSPVDAIIDSLSDRDFFQDFIALGKLGEDISYFVPWIHATYLMAADVRALAYLPDGADVMSLTYNQLEQWGKNLLDATGERLLGFPVGTKGLMHRFLQGYLYPSFTGTMVTGFRSAEAASMWESFRSLWQNVSPRSLTFTRMDQALLSGEVWVAWDHTARVIDALRERPDDFVAFPAPAGPMGRGYLAVLGGLGVLNNAARRDEAIELVDYLTRPETQVLMLETTGFFPVVGLDEAIDLEPGLALLETAVSAQASAADAVPSLLPVGLGEYSTDFNLVYLNTFTQIVLRGNDIRAVLDVQALDLQAVLNAANAPCWSPDDPSEGPCTVE